MFDMAIVEHRFAPHMRDYDIVVDVFSSLPGIKGLYRYRFTHCVVANTHTALPGETWRVSWEDVFLDFDAWEAADCPSGFVWGVCWQNAYPGLSYLENSEQARQWSERLGRPMHEVTIDTGVQVIDLVFHDVFITRIADDPDAGNPDSREDDLGSGRT